MKHEGISEAFRIFRNALAYALFIAMILIWAFPVIWVILTFLKHRTEIFTIPHTILFTPTVVHYVDALKTHDILPSIMKSLLVSVGTTTLTLLIAIPAGYAFSRIFPFRDNPYFFILIERIAPLKNLPQALVAVERLDFPIHGGLHMSGTGHQGSGNLS